MYKIKVYDQDEKITYFDIPIMPRKGDIIGYWEGEDWKLADVDYLVHEFNRDGEYELTEVNVTQG